MDKARFLVEAHLLEGRSVAELAAAHGVHRSWLYKLLARYEAEGEAGLVPRSRRPHHSPAAVAVGWEERIVAIRKQLAEHGLDAGAATIEAHLRRRHPDAPSVTTIWRVLRRRGFVTPQPHKRPKSSYTRFAAELPNECWQMDMTHFQLANGTEVEIINLIDDHSRLCLASVALRVTTALDVAAIFTAARARYGTPAAVLSDNGCIFTAWHRGGKVALETELERLHVTHKHSRPYHPQTCGKVERFHQTLKKYLRALRGLTSLAKLQAAIDTFVAYYNEHRPHRALGRRTPRQTYDARIKARPDRRRAGQGNCRVRHDRVDQDGKLTLRHDSRLHHLCIGRAYRGTAVTLLVDDLDVRVLNRRGELIRHLRIDPNRTYQGRWTWLPIAA